MNTLVYDSGRAKARLTTETPSSHYGIPVLQIEHNGETADIGWGEFLPSGTTGAQFVRAVAAGRAENRVDITGEDAQAALAAALANIKTMGL